MTDVVGAPAEKSVIWRAWREASEAAYPSGVVIRTISSAAEAHQVSTLIGEIWPQPGGGSQIDANLARALAFAGNYVTLAWTEDASAIGTCVAFSSPGAAHLHSHIAGVTAAHAGRGIGRAMKLHQRAWCLERGIRDIGWTFDPLISRNAHFNLVRLGASVSAYVPDFYGGMPDARNDGLRSDRLVLSWVLDRRAPSAARPEAVPGTELISVVGNEPLRSPDATELLRAGDDASIRLPDDYETLRVEAPARAAQWRSLVTGLLSETVGAGHWRITTFRREAGYLLERNR
ncbi:hypothetical protein ACTU3I_05705 [Microbacterium sp. RD1]|uniref:hypothetical protein n=1 Tax=Microbacterium sp. RD1 TaxID=3457313 RepID=UPI003FA52572